MLLFLRQVLLVVAVGSRSVGFEFATSLNLGVLLQLFGIQTIQKEPVCRDVRIEDFQLYRPRLTRNTT